VVEVGRTTRLPDGAPPVLKFVPTQDVPLEDQVSVVELPDVMVVGSAVMTTPAELWTVTVVEAVVAETSLQITV